MNLDKRKSVVEPHWKLKKFVKKDRRALEHEKIKKGGGILVN